MPALNTNHIGHYKIKTLRIYTNTKKHHVFRLQLVLPIIYKKVPYTLLLKTFHYKQVLFESSLENTYLEQEYKYIFSTNDKITIEITINK